MAGLNPREFDEAIDLIRKVRTQGITIIVVEHVIKAIMALSDRILVIHQGTKLAEGKPGEVMKDSKSSRPIWGKATAMLEVKEIDVYYGEVLALRKVSFQVQMGRASPSSVPTGPGNRRS